MINVNDALNKLYIVQTISKGKNKNNLKCYPNNVLAPKQILDKYTLYEFHFSGLHDVYNYLNSYPAINTKVFPELESIKNDYDFAGEPYDVTLDNLINPYDAGYKEFMEIQGLINAGSVEKHKYESIRTIAGGHVNVAAYTAGSPLIYNISRLVKVPKFITINISIGYPWYTGKKQVFNRAIIITNLVKALEKKGYVVNVNAFELSCCADEVVKIVFNVKKADGLINYEMLYKSLCKVEFLRRICFRILETADVKNNWSLGYGRRCKKDMAEKIMNIGKDDIFFDAPDYMGIEGKNLAEDFEKCIDSLNLQDAIDVSKTKREFREKVKLLTK